MANLFRNITFVNFTDWLKASATASVPREQGQSDEWKEPNVSAAKGEAVIALNWGPFHTALYQTVPALIVGATYKIAWKVKRDMQHPDTNPARAADPLSAEARIKAGQAAGPWHTGETLTHNEPVNIFATFVAKAVIENLGVEVRARHSLWQNKFTLSSPSLELVSLPPPGAGDVPSSPPDKLATLTNLITLLTLRVNLTRAVLDGLQADINSVHDEITRLRSLP